jgi:uncharacterized protein with HEPN domain
MTKDPAIFMQHIIDSIELIERRTKDVTYKEFESNIDLQDMVVRRLEIIGEAVKNLPVEFRQIHTDIIWQNPLNMRNFLIHAYFEIDTAVVWDTISQDLPAFKMQIQKLLK